MKKLALIVALALAPMLVSSGCSPGMVRGVAAAAIITGAVVNTAAEIEHRKRYRRCRHHRHYHYEYEQSYHCQRCH